MRHFFLRTQSGFPVCCVATTVVQEPTSEAPELVIRYARSVYNLKDARPRVGVEEKDGHRVYFAIPALPFDRHRHVNAAQGRLCSDKQSRTIVLAVSEYAVKRSLLSVKAAIVADIVANDVSQYAREAAQLWLSENEARVVNGAPKVGSTICEHGEEPLNCQVCYPPAYTIADREAEFNASDEAATAVEEQEWRNSTLSEHEAMNREADQAIEDKEKLDRIFGIEG